MTWGLDMALERRVMWVEGMFLRHHHFQQQDRHWEAMLHARASALHPFHWGLATAEIDGAALEAGAFALRSASGTMPDGLAFSFPDRDPPPPRLEIDRDAINQTVYLVAPEAPAGGRLASAPRTGGGQVSTRYVIEEAEASDALDEGAPPVTLQTGALNLRYEIGDKPRPGFVAMPVGRVAERGSDRGVALVPRYIPPHTRMSASKALSEAVEVVATKLEARAAALAGQYSQVGGSGGAALQEFMLLQLVNAKGCAFNALRDAAHLHPETIFREMVELAGALATFTNDETRRPPAFPRYDHDDLTATFAPVLEELDRSLAYLGVQKAVRIPLKRNQYNIDYGPISDDSLLQGAQFVICAHAAMDSEQFRAEFPRNVSIASVNDIKAVVTAADKSVRIRPLAHPPQELPRMAGWLYLELDTSSEAWGGVQRARTIAIHHAARFPELQVQLWAIRD
ncbi:type VI secretion system baseplate subunit TssK [Rhodovulum sp. DZ06]|uniref:type VI secretion system baseplate subunit TssK n=1 Tax=Rhodovulum sp. DZ06 TaxID=3425126 RepID=UPI003D32ACD5